MSDGMAQIVEGKTQLLVPAQSLSDAVPPKRPVFFNPRAKRTRDITILACLAHGKIGKPGTYLDAMAGVGARGIRISVESGYNDVYVNDLNPQAVQTAQRCAILNGIGNVHFSVQEACRFLADHSARGARGDVVDVDPFGSPAPYMDCAIRATKYKGMLTMTATDLQVLGGLHNAACQRVYGGTPLKTTYGSEIAIRLILGCLSRVAGRLGVGILPLYAESHMHYYRIYARILSSHLQSRTGYIAHCMSCGARNDSAHRAGCLATKKRSGTLWLGKIFDSEFVNYMISHNNDDTYTKHLLTCYDEAEMPPTFYTLDEIAAIIKSGPLPLQSMISRLRDAGFIASATSFSPTGFRTDADIADICSIMRAAKSQ